MSKTLLILCARSDSCDEELKLIEAVGSLLGMKICRTKLTKEEDLKGCLCGQNNEKWDYVYLDTHADIDGFGDADGGLDLKWTKFARMICEADCLESGATLFLACCRGGLKSVGGRLFDNCNQIDYVCGPRWTLNSHDMTAAFHVFLYNLEIRDEQPSTAVARTSAAVGYDFFCYDRAEYEDDRFMSGYYADEEDEETVEADTDTDHGQKANVNGNTDGKPDTGQSCPVST